MTNKYRLPLLEIVGVIRVLIDLYVQFILKCDINIV